MKDSPPQIGDAVADYVQYVSPLTTQFFPTFFKLAMIQPGERVLDLCCGPGDTTFEAAARARADGEVLGVDASPEMIALARQRALEAGLTDARFQVMDASSLDLPDLYWDAVICHLGIADFADPLRALSETSRVLRPVGRVCFSTWGRAERSPWLAIPFDAAHAVIKARPEATRALPFRFGEPGVLSNTLAEAGFGDVTPERITASLEYPDAADYWTAMQRGLAATARPLSGLTSEQLAAVRDAAEPALRRRRHPRTHALNLAAEAFIGMAGK